MINTIKKKNCVKLVSFEYDKQIFIENNKIIGIYFKFHFINI